MQLEIDIGNGLLLTNAKKKHAVHLEALQRVVFPTLSEEEIMLESHFKQYVDVFPEGQFVILHEGKVVASTSTMRCEFDFEHPNHTFLEFTGDLTLSTHQPNGAWLYGLDVMVAPEFRKKGLARAFYKARQKYVQSEKMLGQITAGMLNGYYPYQSKMTPEEYYERLKANDIYDPTVSTQVKIGWEIVGLIPDYLVDPQCGNYGVLMVLPADKVL
jgi:GNAT superfamily N-acetyltransferase